jgi:hypothetical protein
LKQTHEAYKFVMNGRILGKRYGINVMLSTTTWGIHKEHHWEQVRTWWADSYNMVRTPKSQTKLPYKENNLTFVGAC